MIEYASAVPRRGLGVRKSPHAHAEHVLLTRREVRAQKVQLERAA